MTHDTDNKTCACEACHGLRHPEVIETIASLTAERDALKAELDYAKRESANFEECANGWMRDHDVQAERAEAAEEALRTLREAACEAGDSWLAFQLMHESHGLKGRFDDAFPDGVATSLDNIRDLTADDPMRKVLTASAKAEGAGEMTEYWRPGARCCASWYMPVHDYVHVCGDLATHANALGAVCDRHKTERHIPIAEFAAKEARRSEMRAILQALERCWMRHQDRTLDDVFAEVKWMDEFDPGEFNAWPDAELLKALEKYASKGGG